MKNDNNEYLNHLRHSAAHLLAAAVLEFWPDAKRTIGPPIDDGFYYDFDFTPPSSSPYQGEERRGISENDLPKIEEKMKELVKSWKGFERVEFTKEEALAQYPDNPYKAELIEEFSRPGEKLGFYKSGEYLDLCKGGHIENPSKELKYFKLLSLAGAYWRGDEKNKMLTRIYGTAFATKEELEHFLWQKEEAKKRDHRKLGKELELFHFSDLVGKGLPLWLPNGTIMKDVVENFAKDMERKYGYVRVSTPHVAKEELFLTSGHLPYYADGMYPAMKMDDGTYYLRAMNCPHHHCIYQSKPRSYRDLPIRLAEYGMVYRNELSGTLAGLLRVRALQMNDAHIYCRKDQMEEEIERVLNLTVEYFETFGLKEYWFRLSRWDSSHTEKYVNEPENWEFSEEILRKVLQKSQRRFVEVSDEAAFYGPKIDVQFKSVIGREETMSTVQLDFVAKKRFGLTYTDHEGKENTEVFVVHRAPLSTHERFMAFLIEHFAGAFPTWLSPVQIQLIPVNENFNEYCGQLQEQWSAEGIRVEIDEANETVGNKIRKAAGQKVPYILVIGEKEMNSDSFMVRKRGKEEQQSVQKETFLADIRREIYEKQLS